MFMLRMMPISINWCWKSRVSDTYGRLKALMLAILTVSISGFLGWAQTYILKVDSANIFAFRMYESKVWPNLFSCHKLNLKSVLRTKWSPILTTIVQAHSHSDRERICLLIILFCLTGICMVSKFYHLWNEFFLSFMFVWFQGATMQRAYLCNPPLHDRDGWHWMLHGLLCPCGRACGIQGDLASWWCWPWCCWPWWYRPWSALF